jgi:hypothetical protein
MQSISVRSIFFLKIAYYTKLFLKEIFKGNCKKVGKS